MHTSLQKEYNAYLSLKLAFLSRLEALPSDQLLFKPAAEEWSLLEVAEHLWKVEYLTHTSVLKGLSRKQNLKKAGIKAWIRYKLVALVLQYRTKIKAPVAALLPDQNLTLEEIKQEWQAMSETWQQTLETFPAELLGKGVFKHPLAGFFTINQALLFMQDHMRHHEGQVLRIKAKYQYLVPNAVHKGG